MNEFKASVFAAITAQAQILMSGASVGTKLFDGGSHKPDQLVLRNAADLVANVKKYCSAVGLDESYQQASLAEFHLVDNVED